MRCWLLSVAGLVLMAMSSTMVLADDHPTYDSLWHEATAGPGCTSADHSDFILVSCLNDLTLWYFTKPNHPAHPGVIKRHMQIENGAWISVIQGHQFGPDSAQPAFKAWLAQIQDLDRKMSEDLKRRY